MSNVYAVLGSGMQGRAAAYDLATHGEAEIVRLGDMFGQSARTTAEQVNEMVGEELCQPAEVDARDADGLKDWLAGADVVLSAVPYMFGPTVAHAAVEAGCSFCDLGGNTELGESILALDEEARERGVTLVPDCGLAPGLATTLSVYLINKLDETDAIHVRCGGLPTNPRGPLDYMLLFAIEGLTNEYTGDCLFLRNGAVTKIPALTELEEIQFPPPVGDCEAFTTSGGTSTCPKTFEGTIREWTYKTVRYPGHYAKMKAIADLGLLDESAIRIRDQEIVPRDLFHACAGPRLRMTDESDLVVLRVTASGTRAGKPASATLELMEFGDTELGFSAMERMTGFPAAMVAIAIVRGETEKGAIPLERAIVPEPYVAQLADRGITLTETNTSEL